MEDSDIQSAGQSTNQTVNHIARSVERNCTKKLTIPILEEHDATNKILCWKKFTQYTMMTKDIDLTTSREIKEGYRDRLDDRHLHLGTWPICYNGNDKDGRGETTNHVTVMEILFTIPTTLYSREE